MTKKKAEKNKTNDEQVLVKEQLKRALADYDNFRKRVERERNDLEKLVSAKIIIRILPVMDMLEEAQRHLKDSGIALTIEEFRKVLEEEGATEIRAEKGDKFDEELHEAIEVKKGDSKRNGRISELVLRGWKIEDGWVIRPAKVKVYKKD